ncbi:unnamed protein product [Trifolium pratense]|uniref:Uncharacterized protein n=1 Tax=Trifolium pratense TaxID=57577 RepID=A0ACB0MDN7_TRIPR|nr:unnamed protein product [Trifolium pratense]
MATLPIVQYEDKIIETVENNSITVIIGETGSGKSTQLSQMLHRRGYSKIAVTQPRRVAAVSVSRRVAQELGVQLGEEVGYAIRFEDRTSRNTRIKYLTDGVLLRESLADPELNDYSVIILDEAHERSLNTDILMGLMKRLVKHRSSNLKVLITSATLDGDKVSKFFRDCPVLNIPGKLYPVEILYSKERPVSYLDAALKTALDIHVRQPEGDILITALLYHTLIVGCCRLQKFDDALKFLTQMKDFGVSHINLDEYHKLFHSLCLKAMDRKMAIEQLEEMEPMDREMVDNQLSKMAAVDLDMMKEQLEEMYLNIRALF